MNGDGGTGQGEREKTSDIHEAGRVLLLLEPCFNAGCVGGFTLISFQDFSLWLFGCALTHTEPAFVDFRSLVFFFSFPEAFFLSLLYVLG
ncbi:hypothetical protein QBC47DRAFT_395097 [Echria macrotheca]|uniref:Uncharacterized protein n=1 Tax=Echria macrotheca TaxID=438768 RepID=A0AAJ0B4H0_9PEZI|nr:hypothetical protein QBC47DRAFT_395097 [Echria macrotheca]